MLAFPAAALNAAAQDEGVPGLYIQYHAHYLAGLILDPDGHRLPDNYVDPYYLQDLKRRVAVARVGGKLFAFRFTCGVVQRILELKQNTAGVVAKYGPACFP